MADVKIRNENGRFYIDVKGEGENEYSELRASNGVSEFPFYFTSESAAFEFAHTINPYVVEIV